MRARMPWLLRRGWVVLIAIVVVVLVAVAVGERKPVTYSADAKVQVTTGAQGPSAFTGPTPGSASEAQALAADYAGLITADTRILSKVSSATHLSQSEVAASTKVSVINGTSLLDIRFTSGTPNAARVGATSMALAISGKTPVTPAVTTETVTVTQLPSVVTRHVTKLAVVVGIGLILGLLLGAVLVIAWERADARFDRPGQVSGTLGIPARALSDLNALSAVALIDRWRTMSRRKPARVAFIPSVTGVGRETLELVRRLGLISHFAPLEVSTSFDTYRSSHDDLREREDHDARLGPATDDAWLDPDRSMEHADAPTGAGPTTALAGTPGHTKALDDVLLLPSGAPGAEGGEAAAVHADLTVLIVPRGSRVRDAQQSAILLEQVGVRPQWALMIDLGRLSSPQSVPFELSLYESNGTANGPDSSAASLQSAEEKD